MSIKIPLDKIDDAKYTIEYVIGMGLITKGTKYVFKSGNLGYLVKNYETGNIKAITKDEALKNMIVAIQPYIDRGETPPAYYDNATILINTPENDESKIKYALVGTNSHLLSPQTAIDGNPGKVYSDAGSRSRSLFMFNKILKGDTSASPQLLSILKKYDADLKGGKKLPTTSKKAPTISHLLSEISKKFEDDRQIIDDINIVDI